MPNNHLEVVGPLFSIGKCLDFTNRKLENIFTEKNIFSQKVRNLFEKTFKKDLLINSFVECLNNVDLYYLRLTSGRTDEMYYFKLGNKLFHGETIWSQYHPFLPIINEIKPSVVVNNKCWFGGSNPNYTHQLIDFFPNALFQNCCKNESDFTVFGRQNQIITELLNIKPNNLSKPLWLSDIGDEVNIMPGWSVKCIRFSQLYVVRHLSIFLAFSLIKEYLSLLDPKRIMELPSNNIGYFLRNDSRVLNQNSIASYVSSIKNSSVISDLSKKSFLDKYLEISSFSKLIHPPGSENINGFLFANEYTQFIQLLPSGLIEMFDSPFTSYASLRYLLPFLDRTSFCFPDKKSDTDFLSGMWSIEEINSLLN